MRPARRACRVRAVLPAVLVAVLVFGLLAGGGPPARAMIAAVPVITVAEGLAVIAGLVAVGVVAVKLSETDRRRIAAFEARRDWAGLSQLATERIERLVASSAPAAPAPGALGERAPAAVERPPPPADEQAATLAFWLQVRAHARREAGSYAAAAADYLAAATAVGRLPAAELAAARCQMAAGQLAAAQLTLERLTAHATLMWDAHYHLGAVRALRGDLPGAEASLATLRAINPSLADALEADLVRPLRERQREGEAR